VVGVQGAGFTSGSIQPMSPVLNQPPGQKTPALGFEPSTWVD